MTFSLRMLDAQASRIKELLSRDENEAAVIALCGRSLTQDPWTEGRDERFLIREIIEVPADAYFERSPIGFTWSTTPFYSELKKAEQKGFAIAVFHSHPVSKAEFSEADDLAEKELFEIAFNRLDDRRPHLSVVMDSEGAMAARAYGPELKPEDLAEIVVIGERWHFHRAGGDAQILPELDRQVRAFGPKSTTNLASLKIGVVGCGGTGSAVVSLLARVGATKLALFDRDIVDPTNLNRLHFSRRADASLRRKKVDVVGEGAAEIGLPMTILRFPYYADDTEGIAALRSCDVIFGCTDDDLGREVLNRIAHFYFIPVIDLGLLIEPKEGGGYDTFDGRVTVVQPGYPCQACRKLISSEQITLDSLRRDPQVFEERRRAGYVPNDPNPSPVVVTFTTEVATMAVNEFFHRLNGFRGPTENCSERVRRFDYLKDSDTLAGGKSEADCKLCGKRQYDGRGDMQPVLDLSL